MGNLLSSIGPSFLSFFHLSFTSLFSNVFIHFLTSSFHSFLPLRDFTIMFNTSSIFNPLGSLYPTLISFLLIGNGGRALVTCFPPSFNFCHVSCTHIFWTRSLTCTRVTWTRTRTGRGGLTKKVPLILPKSKLRGQGYAGIDLAWLGMCNLKLCAVLPIFSAPSEQQRREYGLLSTPMMLCCI